MTFDQKFWEENGYIVIPNLFSQANLQAVIDAIEKYTGKDSNNPADWYKEPMLQGAMVNMSNNQALWDNRQAPSVHQAFADLWGTEKLWVVLDRANMNPPVGPQWNYEGFLHWDMDPTQPPEPLFQAVLYLTDTTEEMGGFQCVPGSHRRLREWQATHGAEERMPAPAGAERDWMMKQQHPIKDWVMKGLEPRSVVGKAGDFVIWDVALLHGNGKNVSDRPRLAQYISMTPEGTARSTKLVYGGEELRQARIDSWRCGPYPRAVADAIGTPEGLLSQWVSEMLANPAAVREMPQPRFPPRLTDAQLQALPTLLAANKPWETTEVVHAASLHLKYGIGGLFLAAELLSKQIAELMTATFGLAFNVEPAHLTDLGKKLLGIEQW